MFPTCFSRQVVTVPALLLLAAACMNGAAAEAASPAANQWQSAGIGKSTPSSAASSLPADAWRLPNGQVLPAAPTPDSAAPTNVLRTNQSAATSLREPRPMSSPTNARPIAAAPQNTSPAKRINVAQQHGPSAMVRQIAAFAPAGRPAQTTTQPNSQPYIGYPPVARAMPPSRAAMNSNPRRKRPRMNVASNEPEWTGQSEDLPLPGAANKPVEVADPFGSDAESYYLEGDQQFNPGGPGCEGGCCEDGCCGNCGCGEDCYCGDGCCEPTCGCSDGECCEACMNDCCALGPGDPESCNSIRIRVPRWQELAIFGGVQGFKNPYDIDRDRGNFGFHEGFNAGFKIPYTYAGYQIGYQAAQSQLNGTENPSPGSPESHTQHFTTFGLYRRTQDGLQFGSAWDTLVDRRHNTRTFHQIRSEISWLDKCAHEFGFSATVGIMDHEDQEDEDLTWEARDQYLLFYRVHGKRGGEGRFLAGFSDDSDGIIGADMLLPVHDRWSVQTGFTYMIPDANDGPDGSREEAWNLSIAMVWHWDCAARKSHSNPYRPLFSVANNGSMIIDSRDK